MNKATAGKVLAVYSLAYLALCRGRRLAFGDLSDRSVELSIALGATISFILWTTTIR